MRMVFPLLGLPNVPFSVSHLVQLPEVLLLLLVHNNVDTSDGLADDTDLGKLGGGTTGNLGYPQCAQFILEILQLLGELVLSSGAEIGALDFTLENKMRDVKKFFQISGKWA